MALTFLWLLKANTQELEKVTVESITVRCWTGKGGTVRLSSADDLDRVYTQPEQAEQDIVQELEKQVTAAEVSLENARKKLNNFNRSINLKNQGGEKK